MPWAGVVFVRVYLVLREKVQRRIQGIPEKGYARSRRGV